MELALMAMLVLAVSGLLALLIPAGTRAGRGVAAAGLVAGAVLGMIPAVGVLANGGGTEWRLAWNVPYGSLSFGLDPLTALFLIPVLVLSALAGVFAWGTAKTADERGGAGFAACQLNLLAASLFLVLTARNALLFLFAWELTSLAAFFLVVRGDRDAGARRAGWINLTAAHVGAACLLPMFLVLGGEVGSLDFVDFIPIEGNAALNNSLFLLALAGFGIRAGFFPLHVWVPDAHSAAPGHVSAVIAGAMVPTGLYGLLRVLTFLGTPPLWWGWLLAGIGVCSALFGMLFAVGQHDLRRLLAYGSVGNVGIMGIGIGLAVLGQAAGMPAFAGLALAAAFLHMLNHAAFQGLLFLGADAVVQTTGTRQMDRLGGLLRRMPWTGAFFLTGAASVTVLPPFNGFASEFLVYLTALHGITGDIAAGIFVPCLAVIGALALAGGLAAAVFAKAAGGVFLGEPRTPAAGQARETGLWKLVPMALLAAACAIGGFAAVLLLPVLGDVAALWLSEDSLPGLETVGTLVLRIQAMAAMILLLVLILWAGVRTIRRRPPPELEVRPGTWDCGYAAPTPRMQYTPTSFTQPLVLLFQGLLRTSRTVKAPRGVFAGPASASSANPDVVQQSWFRPLFRQVALRLGAFRLIQHGSVHLYILYIALTLIVLLFWKL